MTIKHITIHTIEPLCRKTLRKLARRLNPIPVPATWLC